MEYLRWILLAAGLFFVLIIYLIGSKRRRDNARSDFDMDDEIPEFSAKDWDEAEEGVGQVRIVARENSEVDFSAHEDFDHTDQYDQYDQDENEISGNNQSESAAEEEEQQTEPKAAKIDIIVLYIMARPHNQLTGEKINSAARANGLVFEKMNIFHRLDETGQSVFSLANMVEPGSFDPDTMHDMQTPGIILFMQVSAVTGPESVFDDMLQCAYHMSEMLDAQLCNNRRKPLTQSDAEHYRELVAGADA